MADTLHSLAPLPVEAEAADLLEAKLIGMVLDSVTSLHSRRSYEKGLRLFFAWCRDKPQPNFSKALVGAYRSWLLAQSLAPSTINLRLSPVRKLAREMADNGLVAPDTAAAIERVPGVKQQGIRAGNWLGKEQASELLNAPSPLTLKGKRDRAMLALLLGCGLRRAELLSLTVDQIAQRQGRWVIPDLAGKGQRRRTVPVPAAVKIRVEEWILAAELDLSQPGGKPGGKLFRPISKAGKITGPSMQDEKGIWQIVVQEARQTSLGKLSPHDLRRTCAKLCRKAGGELEQIQMLLGHASIQTTERYLGTVQHLTVAVNDAIGLEMD
jgi:site-specific recombinase XerD